MWHPEPKASAGRQSPLDGIAIQFRTSAGAAYTAVEGVSLDVAAGEFVAIVGPTGCGKSTLLNVVAGLLKPAQGRASVLRRYLSLDRARTRYGVVIRDGKIDLPATQQQRELLMSRQVKLSIEKTEVDAHVDGRRICYLSPSDMSRLSIPDDSLVELVNPRGAPLRAWARSLDTLATGTTALGPIGRAALAKDQSELLEFRVL